MPSESHSRRNVPRLPIAALCVPRSVFLTLAVMLMCPLACASNTQGQALASMRDTLAELDEFGALLLQAGVPFDRLPKGRELSVEEARRLRVFFSFSPWTPQQYSPRLVATLLLRGVEASDEPTSRAELGRHIQEFLPLVLLRPDGDLARALTGEPVRCVGPVQPGEGAGRADIYELDAFYKPDEKTGELRRVDVALPAAWAQ